MRLDLWFITLLARTRVVFSRQTSHSTCCQLFRNGYVTASKDISCNVSWRYERSIIGLLTITGPERPNLPLRTSGIVLNACRNHRSITSETGIASYCRKLVRYESGIYRKTESAYYQPCNFWQFWGRAARGVLN